MLTQLDPTRFNLAIQTGRRFYVACSLLRKYSLFFINADYAVSFNKASFRSSQYDHRLQVNVVEDFFNSMNRSNFDDEEPDFESELESDDYEENYTHEFYPYDGKKRTQTSCIVTCFDSEMYINRYANLNYSEFRNAFYGIYDEKVANAIYAATCSIVPMEVSGDQHIKIVCSHGDIPKIEWGFGQSFPLVDILYRSDEMMNFVEKFISMMMMSTLFHHNLIVFGEVSIENGYSVAITRLYRHYRTWSENIFSLAECFSLYPKP